ncbi:MAG: NADH-quinone oxidoreductase subunit N [Desulfuromonadales bacterium]|nr:NADH-quinone oxidoreductase subunit N [Desulfuromonadales bacterium]
MENLVQAALKTVNFYAIMPSVILVIFGMVLLLIGVFSKPGRTTHIAWIGIIGLICAAAATVSAWNGLAIKDIGIQFGFADQVAQDGFALFFNIIFIFSAALTILMSDDYLRREGYPINEFYSLILFATAGSMWMASATDMMTIFLGLEVLSVSLYVLAGFFYNDVRSNEAGLKYFLLGAFSTGFLLYGMALLYGVTGTTNLSEIGLILSSQHQAMLGNPMTIAGMLLLSTGFLFKIGVVPFHMWAPDVYQGAPTPITAFMSAGPKAAALAAFMRILLFSFAEMQVDWSALLWILAVLTMTIGNFMAVSQTNIKRMLAYSSITHAGYALVGLVAANYIGFSGILYYMLAYTFMNLGAFAVLVLAGKKGENNLTYEGLAGFGFKRPFLGVALSIFILSLMGMPPTAGFTAKFYIFAGAIKAEYIWLAVIGVLNSAVSLYYYLRVLVAMYFRDPQEDFAWVSMPLGAMVSIIISLVGVLYLGLLPERVMELARIAIF